MAFEKTFDELLDGVLTDYRNQFPGVDTSQGSLVFIKSACLASALWGAYQHQRWVSDQIFPDTADAEALAHHAWLRSIVQNAGESAASLAERVVFDFQHPPGGGNRYDYERWAREVVGVRYARCYPLGQGLGTVDVLVLADAAVKGAEIPTSEFLAEIKAYIDSVRPVTAKLTRVLAPTVITRDVRMAVVGTVDRVGLAADVTSYVQSLIPMQPLAPAQLSALALARGATDAPVAEPASTVTPANYSMIRPGTVTIE